MFNPLSYIISTHPFFPLSESGNHRCEWGILGEEDMLSFNFLLIKLMLSNLERFQRITLCLSLKKLAILIMLLIVLSSFIILGI